MSTRRTAHTNSTQEDIVVVGRITHDADSSAETSVRLNEASLTLESSRAMGSGARIHLRFDTNVRMKGMKRGIGGMGVFPGAIVALRGRNGGGGWFTVTEVLPVRVEPSVLDVQFSIPCDSFLLSPLRSWITSQTPLRSTPSSRVVPLQQTRI